MTLEDIAEKSVSSIAVVGETFLLFMAFRSEDCTTGEENFSKVLESWTQNERIVSLSRQHHYCYSNTSDILRVDKVRLGFFEENNDVKLCAVK
jgi:hypothetical protein